MGPWNSENTVCMKVKMPPISAINGAMTMASSSRMRVNMRPTFRSLLGSGFFNST